MPLQQPALLAEVTLSSPASALLLHGDTVVIGTASGTVCTFRLVPRASRGPTPMELALMAPAAAAAATEAASTATAAAAAAASSDAASALPPADGPLEWLAGPTLVLRSGVSVDALAVAAIRGPGGGGGDPASDWLLVSCGGEVSAHLLPRLGGACRLVAACTGALCVHGGHSSPSPPPAAIATAHYRRIELWGLQLVQQPSRAASAAADSRPPPPACAATRRASLPVQGRVAAVLWSGGHVCATLLAQAEGAGGGEATYVVLDAASAAEVWRLQARLPRHFLDTS